MTEMTEERFKKEVDDLLQKILDVCAHHFPEDGSILMEDAYFAIHAALATCFSVHSEVMGINKKQAIKVFSRVYDNLFEDTGEEC